MILIFFLLPCTAVRNADAALKVAITVEGVEGEVMKNVLAYLSIQQQKDHSDLTLHQLEKLHQDAPDEIQRALQPFGYYRPEIQSALSLQNDTWQAVYRINPGPQVIIHDIDITVTGEGSRDERFAGLKDRMTVREGDVLNHRLYEEAKKMIHDLAMQAGYVKARMVTSRVEVFPEADSASVIMHFDTGEQYAFGQVHFIQDTFSDTFLSGFVPFRRGEPYSSTGLLSLQNALNDSDYFSSVSVTPLLEQAGGREVPVEVRLVPRKRNRFTFGIGYGTDTGIRGSAGWEDRRINKRGHRFKAELKVSEIRSQITAGYFIPLRKPRTDNLVYAAGWLTENTKTSESERYFGGVRYEHMRKQWKETVYINYEHEQFEIGDESGTSTLVIPGVSWTRTKADDPVSPRRGSRLFLDVRGTHEALLSDSSFLQIRAQAKYIRGIMPGGRLLIRGEGGTSVVRGFEDLPPSARFFAGGDNSVRGYAYNSLGPEDDEGHVRGGRNLLVGSAEYDHRIRDKWSAALFYDAGNAFDSLSESLMQGVGFGIRWASPVGPVRVDLAFPLNESDQSWRIHFVVGPDL